MITDSQSVTPSSLSCIRKSNNTPDANVRAISSHHTQVQAQQRASSASSVAFRRASHDDSSLSDEPRGIFFV
jgi:hypothetical protein